MGKSPLLTTGVTHMNDPAKPFATDHVEIPEQSGPSVVDEMRVPLAEWTDPGAAGRVKEQIIRSID
jgi:hypothetical protein